MEEIRGRNGRVYRRESLYRLYHIDHKTLQEIGDLYDVTRESIRQVFNKLDILTIKKRLETFGTHRKSWNVLRYKTLTDYLNSTSAKNGFNTQQLKKYFSELELHCSECGSNQNIHFHHIVYPAQSLQDIQILCASCHRIKHHNKFSLVQQIDLYNEYLDGASGVALAIKYSISQALAYKIIHKLKNGWHTLRG